MLVAIVFFTFMLGISLTYASVHQYRLTQKFRKDIHRKGQQQCPHFRRWEKAQDLRDRLLQQQGASHKEYVSCVHREISWTHPGSRFWGPVGDCCPFEMKEVKLRGFFSSPVMIAFCEMSHFAMWFGLYAVAGLCNTAISPLPL